MHKQQLNVSVFKTTMKFGKKCQTTPKNNKLQMVNA